MRRLGWSIQHWYRAYIRQYTGRSVNIEIARIAAFDYKPAGSVFVDSQSGVSVQQGGESCTRLRGTPHVDEMREFLEISDVLNDLRPPRASMARDWLVIVRISIVTRHGVHSESVDVRTTLIDALLLRKIQVCCPAGYAYSLAHKLGSWRRQSTVNGRLQQTATRCMTALSTPSIQANTIMR